MAVVTVDSLSVDITIESKLSGVGRHTEASHDEARELLRALDYELYPFGDPGILPSGIAIDGGSVWYALPGHEPEPAVLVDDVDGVKIWSLTEQAMMPRLMVQEAKFRKRWIPEAPPQEAN